MDIKRFKTIYEFQDAFPTRELREKEAMKMSDQDLDHIISICTNIYAKIYYADLKKRKRRYLDET